jgi:hypothetical protein
MLHHIHDIIYLSSSAKERLLTENTLEWGSRSRFILAHTAFAMQVGSGSTVLNLSVIQEFCNQLQCALFDFNSKNPLDRIVICPTSEDTESILIACTLLGAHLILNGSKTLEAVVDAFRGLSNNAFDENTDLQYNGIAALDCWRALDRAMHLGWLVDPESEVEPTLDLEEFAHYASGANGSVHMAVPGKMFFFSSPEVMPIEHQWTDSVAHDGTTTRRFSPAFYADLLDDLGVSAVVCLGRSDAAASSAFAERGIEAVDLALAADGSSLLRGLDRLLSLAAAAPGAVAVHSGDGAAWPAYTETLVVAVLISRLGFDEGAARAWIRMLCPWMLPAAAAAAAAAAPPRA